MLTVTCQGSKKADWIGSYKAGKLEGSKARKLPGFPASQPSSYELSATRYFALAYPGPEAKSDPFGLKPGTRILAQPLHPGGRCTPRRPAAA